MLPSLVRAAALRAPQVAAASAAAASRSRAAASSSYRGFASSSSSSSASGSGSNRSGSGSDAASRIWDSIRGTSGHRPHGRTWSYSSHRSRARDSSYSSSKASAGSTTTASTEAALVPSRPEARYRDVLAVPLARRPLFPGVLMPVTVDDPRLVAALRQAVAESRAAGGGQPYVGAFLKREAAAAAAATASPAPPAEGAAAASAAPLLDLRTSSASEGSSSPAAAAAAAAAADDLHEVGTFAQIHTLALSSSSGLEEGEGAGSAQLLLLGHRRLRRTGVVAAEAPATPAGSGGASSDPPSPAPPPLRVTVEHLRDEPHDADADELRATAMEAVATLKELLTMHPLYNEQLKSFAALGGDFHDPGRLADVAASLCSAPGEELQGLVLEELRVPERAAAALLLLKKEAELCRLQADIGRRVEEKISKDQRKYFLTEQLRSIKKELGLEKDDKAALVQRFRERLAATERKRRGEGEAGEGGVDGNAAGSGGSIPEEARRVIDEELGKLQALEPSSSEFNVTRNYLEWLTAMPWGVATVETLDVQRARETLDRDHYGLADVKARVLEFIAVGALRGGTAGKILCLAGPPGVGKTSVGRSIANALGRKYYRFSVGGLADVAEIKGHRRTYVGAMPGKAVQCLKACGVSDPLILIDEIDKLGRGHQGDPASALLELLDPEQNATFLDHYLDVPLDLSRVLFVCTANVLEAIPGPLLDRMEVIRIPGYYGKEKEAIARGYLEPAARADAGVPAGAVALDDGALRRLIDEYCSEAGVRNLKKQIEKVYRKAALRLVESGSVVLPPSGGGGGGGDAKRREDDDEEEGEKKKKGGASSSSSSSSSSSAAAATAPATAATLVEGTPAIRVTPETLADFVGQPPFSQDKLYSAAEGRPPPPGVATGLAWTAGGGSTLHVEAAVASRRRRGSGEKGGEKGSSGGGSGGKGALSSTGQLGEVMRESTTIAHTVARAVYAKLVNEGRSRKRSGKREGDDDEDDDDECEDASSSSCKNDNNSFTFGDAARRLAPVAAADPAFFADASIHVHVPAGATPKDGPSAGVTLATALLSLALGEASDPHLAMTGEVSLTGRVLPVGGVKEKVLAARRAGVRRVALPEANRRDWDELAADVREGIDASFHEDFGSVFEVAFGGGAGGGGEEK